MKHKPNTKAGRILYSLFPDKKIPRADLIRIACSDGSSDSPFIYDDNMIGLKREGLVESIPAHYQLTKKGKAFIRKQIKELGIRIISISI